MNEQRHLTMTSQRWGRRWFPALDAPGAPPQMTSIAAGQDLAAWTDVQLPRLERPLTDVAPMTSGVVGANIGDGGVLLLMPPLAFLTVGLMVRACRHSKRIKDPGH